MKRILLTAAIASGILISCKSHEKTTSTSAPAPALNCGTAAYTYEADIRPIMTEHCAGCHNTNMKGGYNLGDVESVKRAGGNGFLLGTIKHMAGYDPMPAGGREPLDQATIDKIECWIKTGMK